MYVYMYVCIYVYIHIYIFIFVKVKFSHIFFYLRGFCTLFVLTLVSSSCIYLSLLSLNSPPCSTIIALSSTRIIILSGCVRPPRTVMNILFIIYSKYATQIYMYVCIYVCMHARMHAGAGYDREYLTNPL